MNNTKLLESRTFHCVVDCLESIKNGNKVRRLTELLKYFKSYLASRSKEGIDIALTTHTLYSVQTKTIDCGVIGVTLFNSFHILQIALMKRFL